MLFSVFLVISCSSNDDNNYSTPYKLSSKTLNESVIQSPVSYKIPDIVKYLYKLSEYSNAINCFVFIVTIPKPFKEK